MIGASSQHTCAPPSERGSLGNGVGFIQHLPAAIDRCVIESEFLVLRGRTAQGRFRRKIEHGHFADGVVIPTSFEHEDLQARVNKHIGAHPAAGSGADNNDVIGITSHAYWSLHGIF